MITPINTLQQIRSAITFKKITDGIEQWTLYPGHMFDVSPSVDNRVVVHPYPERSARETQLIKFTGNEAGFTVTYVIYNLDYITKPQYTNLLDNSEYQDLATYNLSMNDAITYVKWHNRGLRDTNPVRTTGDMIWFLINHLETTELDSRYIMEWHIRNWGPANTPDTWHENYNSSRLISLPGFLRRGGMSINHKRQTVQFSLSFIVGDNPLATVSKENQINFLENTS